MDNPGLQTLTLKRTYQGEEIELEVHMPDLVTSENDDDPDGDVVKRLVYLACHWLFVSLRRIDVV